MNALTVASDEDLLEAVATGDRDAFTRLYARTVRGTSVRVGRVLQNQAQAEEIVQEVYLQIWQTAGRYDRSKARASTWIQTVAHRRAVDRVRHTHAAHRRDLTAGRRDVEVGYDHVAETVHTTIDFGHARQAISRLSAKYRDVVELSYLHGLSQQAIADRLGIPLGTIKSRLNMALVTLRHELTNAT